MKYTFNELTFWKKNKLAILVTIFVIIIIAVILYFVLKPSSDHSFGSTPASTKSPSPSTQPEDFDDVSGPDADPSGGGGGPYESAACIRGDILA